MENWWYIRNDERVGPVSIEDLKTQLQRGSIEMTTMVWQEGMEAWLQLRDVPALAPIKQAVPPPIPYQSESDRLLSLPLASRWPRFFARIFDLWWEALLLGLLAGMVLGRYSAGFLEWLYKPGAGQLLGLLLIPFALLLDAIVYALFGNTPGKSLLGLRVTTLQGQRLSLGQYLGRNIAIWLTGLGAAIPLISIFTMARQGRRIIKGKQASYDEPTGVRVHGQQMGILRPTIFGLAFCALFVLMAVLNDVERDREREAVATVLQKFYVWENPITKVNTSIDAKWKFNSQNNDQGQRVFMFTEPADHAVVIFGQEDAPGADLGDYVRAFQKATSAKMSFADGGQFSEANGRPSWRGNGAMIESPGSRLRVRVVQVGTTFWRVVTIQAPPYEYSDTMVKVLENTLWESLPLRGGRSSM